MSATVIVVLDVEPAQIGHVGGLHLGDQVFFGPAFLTGPDHRRRAMGVVGAKVPAFVAAEFLKANPDVSLHSLQNVTQVNMAIHVGQGGGDENAAFGHEGEAKVECYQGVASGTL